MDNMSDDISSTGFKPLFIREDKGDPDETVEEQKEGNENPSGLSFNTQFKQPALVKPYLQEMDDLLRSCEELTGIRFGSCHSAGDTETCLSSKQGKEDVTMGSYQEICSASQAYLSTSYMDTSMDETENETIHGQSFGDFNNRCEVYQQTEMPLSSAGTKLSATMVEYEGQLLGMLAMLENCMEEDDMNFELQDQAADSGQEYVHISKNLYHCRGTTLTIEPEGPPELETLQVQSKLCVDGGKAPKGRGNESLAEMRPEWQGNLTPDRGVSDLHFRSSSPQEEPTDQDPGYMFEESKETKRDVSEIDIDDNEVQTREKHEVETDLRSDLDTLGALGSQMEDCIEKVQLLQKRRKELLVEVLQLRGHKEQEEAEGRDEEESEEWVDSKVVELMNVLKIEEEARREERRREICSLREERAEEEKKIWKVNLERQGLQEELKRLKRRLFAVARDCAYSQAAVNNHRREVELLKREEEKLNSLVLQLTGENCQLRSAQQQQLLVAQEKPHSKPSSQTSNTQEELTECRRSSCGDIQQYLQSGLKALEDRYEPILLALLKRREAAAGALVKAKQQAQDLRAQLSPLRQEIQKLKLQKTCLEEKLKLVTIQRWDDVGHYKEAVFYLEEQSRELKTELEIQKRKNKEMEVMRENLTKQLLLHRAADESHKTSDQEEKT